jgi:hypothetical protein
MIIYNIRKNGPYEYDKFILNVFQLKNKVYQHKKDFEKNEIHSKLKFLDETIDNIIKDDSCLNRLVLLGKVFS